MYPISSTAKGYFDSNKKQVINIRMDTENETYTITENDVISGSFSIDRYSITGNRIEIGTACASECKFRIKNYSNQWDNVKFEGAVLYIRIGIADWDNYTSESDIVWIPCGYFTIDKPVKNASILSIEALDRMAKLDKPVDWTNFQVTHTVSYLVSRICDICDVVLANGSAIASMPNANYQVTFDMSADITYRNLLQAACMLLGACAFFNENGQLVIKWYSATDVTINESKRYSHTIYENNIQITGVIYVDDTDSNNPVEYISGTKGYCIDISDNPLVGEDIQDVVDALGAVLNGFTYRPYSAVIKPSPYLYPMDMITFVKNNVSYTGIVSNITFGVNSNTSIEGKGETDEDNGYATYGNFTNVQSKIIEYAKNKVDKEINERTLLLMNLNEMVMNSLGLYETSIQRPGGGYQYYFHDASTLADSTIIYTFGANGFAWTDDWNDGDPIWHYGITRDGNAIVNMLSAYKISADIITAGTMRAVNLIFGTDPNTTELRTNDESTGALFEGSGVMQFETKGEFRAKNMDSDDNTANRIMMKSGLTTSAGRQYNQFSFTNRKNNITANELFANAYDDGVELWLYNNRPGSSLNANSHYMGVSSNLYENRLNNLRYDATSSSGAAINANNLVLQSYKTSENENNFAGLRNYSENGTMVNYVTMRSGWKGTVSNELYIANQNNTGYNANRIWFGHESAQNSLYLYNYHRDVTGPSYALLSNDMRIYSNSSENRVQLKNYYLKAYDGTDTGAFDANLFYMSSSRSTSQNTIRFENRLISSATAASTRTSVISNLIEMLAVPNGGNHTVINNYNKYGAGANTINMDASSYPYVRFINYQKDNAFSGPYYVASSIYLKQTDVINSFDFYNNKKSTTTGLDVASGNHLAMYTYSSNSSSVFRVDNYHWNGNLGNQIDMGSYNNSSSFALRNYNSSGVARSWLTMSGDGTLELGGNTGGTSRLTLNSNGNLDLIGRNVAYIAASNSNGYVAIKTKGNEKICEWSYVDGLGYFLKGIDG